MAKKSDIKTCRYGQCKHTTKDIDITCDEYVAKRNMYYHTSEQEYTGFKAIENTEIMRYQIIFDGKSEVKVRELLKSNGFKWAPSQNAWQRQITANGKYAFEKVIKALPDVMGQES